METISETKNDFSRIVYVVEKNNYGHIICVLKHFNPVYHKKKYDDIIKYMVKICADALNISKKYNNKTIFTHIYLNDCSTQNFSMKLAKKMTTVLYRIFADTLEKGYIYSRSKFFAIIFKLLSVVLAAETMKKFTHIKIK